MPTNDYTTIDVAIPLPLQRTFHYTVPELLRSAMAPGIRVLVPFGHRKLTGYVLGPGNGSVEDLKEILAVLDTEPLMAVRDLAFYRWIADYYLQHLGEVIKTALPAGINISSRHSISSNPDGSENRHEQLSGGRTLRRERFYRPTPGASATAGIRGIAAELLLFLLDAGEAPRQAILVAFPNGAAPLKRLLDRGLVLCEEREVYRDPFREQPVEPLPPQTLNQAQQVACQELTSAISTGGFAPFLLHGVTGSGKTEVYLHAIAHALEQGKQALVLTPEIALTPQLVRRFRGRFACGIAVLHSGLSADERFDQWRRIRRSEADIVIGARSAIFAPLDRLGIIVVDEEHEASYKQADGVPYNARDLALVRGTMERATVLLGSATPLITSYYAAREGRLRYLHLPERAQGQALPATRIIDSRLQKGASFAPELCTALAENLHKGGQSLLFLNRRGFATYLLCRDCGHVFRCPNCAVTLTHHRGKQRHFCHYCDYSLPAPSLCPECSGSDIGLFGRGTERVEDEIRELLPHARVARMDSDTTSTRGSHARILRQLERCEIDILIGTQMIAKGHDYPGVTLVGVISADATLNLPDFRSAERTFQMVSQVMGRAGRGQTPGLVLIQGMNPDHYALTRAATHDYEGFFEDELAFRRDAGYPPFAYLALVSLSGTAEQNVARQADRAALLFRELRRRQQSRPEILGPAPAPLAKVRGRFRWQILLKADNRNQLKQLLIDFQTAWQPPASTRTRIDIDPVDTL